jgi:hypothetical protein
MNPQDDWVRDSQGKPVTIPFELLPKVIVSAGENKYLTNCNETFDVVVTPRDPNLALENFPKELYRAEPTFETSRGKIWRQYLGETLQTKGSIEFEDIVRGSQEEKDLYFTDEVVPRLYRFFRKYSRDYLSDSEHKMAQHNFNQYFKKFDGDASASSKLMGYMALFKALVGIKSYLPIGEGSLIEEPETLQAVRELKILAKVEDEYLSRWDAYTPWGELFKVWNGNKDFRFYPIAGGESSQRSFSMLLVDLPPILGGSVFMAEGGQTHVQISNYSSSGNRFAVFAPTQGGDLYNAPWYDQWTQNYSRKNPIYLSTQKPFEAMECQKFDLAFEGENTNLSGVEFLDACE